MIGCPKCGSVEVISMAGVQRIVWEKKHRWWGPVVPRGATVALHVTCNDCFFSFTARKDGSFRPAPVQDVHKTHERETGRASPDGDKPERAKAAPLPRPAGDPRVKPKR